MRSYCGTWEDARVAGGSIERGDSRTSLVAPGNADRKWWPLDVPSSSTSVTRSITGTSLRSLVMRTKWFGDQRRPLDGIAVDDHIIITSRRWRLSRGRNF